MSDIKHLSIYQFSLIILSPGNHSKFNLILINLHKAIAFSFTLLSPGNYLKCHLILTNCLVFVMIIFFNFSYYISTF